MARELDPVLVEVIRNELAAVSEEMAIATVRTARCVTLANTISRSSVKSGEPRQIAAKS